MVRNKIKMFAQKKVTLLPGRHKIVILDEADRYIVCASGQHKFASTERKSSNPLNQQPELCQIHPCCSGFTTCNPCITSGLHGAGKHAWTAVPIYACLSLDFHAPSACATAAYEHRPGMLCYIACHVNIAHCPARDS